MTKIYKVLFLVIAFFCMFSPHTARATHVMGSDITWKCLGGDTFLITVSAYRDCNGIPLSGTNLQYESTDGSCTAGFVSASPNVCCGTDITPVCGRSCSRCISNSSCPFPLGIEQFTITATVVLKAPCCNYTISWEECCRNDAITTGAQDQDFWSDAQLNRCITKPCDNSPYFTSPPVGIFCVNQCVVYNPGANDDDRDVNGDADSLAFSFGDPLSGPGSPIPYTSPYSNDAPLIYSGNKDDPFIPPNCYGFHIDPLTGDIMFKAKKTDQTVFVIVVDEYRKDSLGIERKIGEVRRDLQIAIIDCPANQPPIVTGINGGNTYSIKLCADQSTCFTIKAFDLDPPDSVTMSWNNQIPTATFTVKPDGKKWPTGTFCWRPTSADVRSYPYQFVVTALDNHCPIPGRGVKAFSVYVIASPQANYSATILNCGKVKFRASVAATSTTTITDYLWVGDGAQGYGPLYIHADSGTYQYTRAGTYHYQLTVTGPNKCTYTYTDSVKIPPFVYVSLPPDKTVCANAPPLTVQATFGLGNRPYDFVWNTGDKGPNATSITQKITKDTAFVVHITDGNNCTNYDSMKVFLQKLPQPRLGPDQRGCGGHLLTLNTQLTGVSSTTFWTEIQGSDTIRNFTTGNPIQVHDAGIYTAFVKDSFGCPGSDTINIYFNPLVQAKTGDTDVCINDSVPMDAGIAGPNSKFIWVNRAHPSIILSTSRHYTIPSATDIFGYPMEVIISQTENGLTCADTGYPTVKVHPLPVPAFKPLPDKCVNEPAFSLEPFVDAAHQNGGYWYYPKNYSAIVGNYLYPSVMGVTINDPTLGWVHYHYTDQFGCTSDDSELIKISTLPQVYAGPDTEICTANGKYLLNAPGRFNPTGGLWTPLIKATSRSVPTPKSAIVVSTFGDSILFDPSQVPQDTVYGVIYQYTHTTGTSASCDNADTVYISVKTNPKIQLTPLPLLCAGMGQQPLVGSPGGGVWSIADGTNPAALVYDQGTKNYYFDPAVSDSGYHKVAYEAWADYNRKLCSTIDTMLIYVAPAPVISFKTQDNKYEYCESNGVVKLVPNQNWPDGSFTGKGVYNTGGIYYFDPTGKTPTGADTTGDSTKNTVTYNVPYNNGNCNVTSVRHIAVDPHPAVHINTSPSQCSGSNHIDLVAAVANIPDAQHLVWSSPDGGGQAVTNVKLVGNVATATYFPTQIQLQTLKYVIRLVGYNNGVCDSSVSVDTISIFPRPEPNFLALPSVGCDPLTTHFTSSFLLPGKGTINYYDWDFGDSTPHETGNVPAVDHVYHVTNGQSSQQFTVKLLMSTAIHMCVGEKDSLNYVTVYSAPKPFIDATPAITTIAVPKVQFDVDEHLSRGINFSDPKTSYMWTFGDDSAGKPTTSDLKNPIHVYADTGNFKVFVTVVSNQCSGIDSTIIHVQPELIIFIPNVFMPGGKTGDGKPHGENHFGLTENSTFQPVVSGYASFTMSIYNRWGELMYTTNDPSPAKGWDGTFQGAPAPMDAYVYVIKATSFSGKPYTFTGSVTILQ